MAKQMRVGVKAAWIGGFLLIVAAIITGLFSYFNNKASNGYIQSNDKQKVDSGSINNYSASRDLKIENNVYNTDSSIDKDKSKITSTNQIINNEPNQGVQVNQNNGTIITSSEMPRELIKSDIIRIKEKLPKEDSIHVLYCSLSEETMKYAKEIFQFLKKSGYKVDYNVWMLRRTRDENQNRFEIEILSNTNEARVYIYKK